MENLIDHSTLLGLLVAQIPEARDEFSALSPEADTYTIVHKLQEVTSILAHQNKFRAVKHCLLAAEDLLLHAQPAISHAVCTIYVHYLGMLLDKRDSRAEVIRYLLPKALLAEYRRQLMNHLP